MLYFKKIDIEIRYQRKILTVNLFMRWCAIYLWHKCRAYLKNRMGGVKRKYKSPDNVFIVVENWMRNHSTISFLGLWEQIHNPNFKPIEFDRFKAESGDNAFTLTPQQWIKATDASIVVTHRIDWMKMCLNSTTEL